MSKKKVTEKPKPKPKLLTDRLLIAVTKQQQMHLLALISNSTIVATDESMSAVISLKHAISNPIKG